eukprot:9235016-Lingulodinium_polyedra.AAC.1
MARRAGERLSKTVWFGLCPAECLGGAARRYFCSKAARGRAKRVPKPQRIDVRRWLCSRGALP